MWLLDNENANIAKEYELRINDKYVDNVKEMLHNSLTKCGVFLIENDKIFTEGIIEINGINDINSGYLRSENIYVKTEYDEKSKKLLKKWLKMRDKSENSSDDPAIYLKKSFLKFNKPFTIEFILSILYEDINDVKIDFDLADFQMKYIEKLSNNKNKSSICLKDLIHHYSENYENFLLLADSFKDNKELLNLFIKQYPDIFDFKTVFSYVDLIDINNRKQVNTGIEINVQEILEYVEKNGLPTLNSVPALVYYDTLKAIENDNIIKKLDFKPNSIIK